LQKSKEKKPIGGLAQARLISPRIHGIVATYKQTHTNLMTETYNGWANWETWNVALWIQNEEGLYKEAKRCANYQQLVNFLYDCGFTETPDGVKWDDANIDGIEVNEMMKDL
jgi:peptidyl-tRNA hydrolase